MNHKNGSGQNRTPAERRILNRVAEKRGQQFAEENAELILAQAREFGDLPADEER